jgi:hypothetical protein
VGLLFVKDKQRLGIYMIAGTILGIAVLVGAVFVISIVTLGIGAVLNCCFLLVPLWNLVAAVYTYDAAAKESNGKYQPIFFK